MPDYPFWIENFYTQQDTTTQEDMEATDKIITLPAEFFLVQGLETAYDVGNLEFNPDMVKSIKKILLFSKLEKGEYETAGSKSYKTNIAGASNS